MRRKRPPNPRLPRPALRGSVIDSIDRSQGTGKQAQERESPSTYICRFRPQIVTATRRSTQNPYDAPSRLRPAAPRR